MPADGRRPKVKLTLEKSRRFNDLTTDWRGRYQSSSLQPIHEQKCFFPINQFFQAFI